MLSGDSGVLKVAVIKLFVGTSVAPLTGVTEITVGPIDDLPLPPQPEKKKEAASKNASPMPEDFSFTVCSLG
jgi:hypothetical protein